MLYQPAHCRDAACTQQHGRPVSAAHMLTERVHAGANAALARWRQVRSPKQEPQLQPQSSTGPAQLPQMAPGQHSNRAERRSLVSLSPDIARVSVRSGSQLSRGPSELLQRGSGAELRLRPSAGPRDLSTAGSR